MITLRPLKIEDKVLMKEWMLDPEVTQFFRFNEFNDFKVTNFINNSINDVSNKHLAIINESDEYLGTISLKNIDLLNHHAEYAIVLRKKYWGKGIGKISTQLILDYAIQQGLHKIYLNVLKTNSSAIKLYTSCGFIESGVYKDHLLRNGIYYDLLYFEKILGNKNEL